MEGIWRSHSEESCFSTWSVVALDDYNVCEQLLTLYCKLDRGTASVIGLAGPLQSTSRQ